MSRLHSAQIGTSEMGPGCWIFKYFIHFKVFVEFLQYCFCFMCFWGVLAMRHIRS